MASALLHALWSCKDVVEHVMRSGTTVGHLIFFTEASALTETVCDTAQSRDYLARICVT
jgi:hypothetical protein